jgi:hypothetical protein
MIISNSRVAFGANIKIHPESKQLPEYFKTAVQNSRPFFEQEHKLDPAEYLICYAQVAGMQIVELVKKGSHLQPRIKQIPANVSWNQGHAEKWLKRNYFAINGMEIPEAYKKTKGE